MQKQRKHLTVEVQILANLSKKTVYQIMDNTRTISIFNLYFQLYRVAQKYFCGIYFTEIVTLSLATL